MCLRLLGDFIFLCSAAIWLLRLIWQGYLPPAHGIGALLALLVLRASGWILGREGRPSLIIGVLNIGVAFSSLLIALAVVAGGDLRLLIPILLVAWLAWFISAWLYVLIVKEICLCRILDITLSPLIWLIPLVAQGYISPLEGFLFWAALAFLGMVGLRISKSRRGMTLVFRLALLIASIAVFPIVIGNVSWAEMVKVWGALVALLLALGGLYLMFRGLPS